MKALIIVDIQKDFCPGGTLAVNNGNAVIEPSNQLIEAFRKAGLPIVLTRDWHPQNHSSFADFGGIWPVHCVAETSGAEFHPSLVVPDAALIISKADKAKSDAYSGFEGTNLDETLTALGVDEVIVTGLATDYCVKNTVLDARKLGYKTIVAEEAIKAVNINPEDGIKAVKEMQDAGAKMTSTSEVLATL